MSIDTQPIESFQREGGWTTQQSFYYEAAKRSLQDAIKKKVEIVEKIEELKAKNLSIEDDFIYRSWFAHETEDERHKLEKMCISAQLFSCMAVEAFLNLYGVKRLGQDFYKQNIERVGITEKLEILIAIGQQELLAGGNKLTKLVRSMFDRRNQLVHPKTKEIRLSEDGKINWPQIYDELEKAEELVSAMDSFFKLLKELDPDIAFLTNMLFMDSTDLD